jgi:acid phosphatase type 7
VDDDVICGGRGRDVIYARPGRDVVYGGRGADALYAGRGADVPYGGSGADVLHGQGSGDLLFSDDGIQDRVAGGAGRDRGRLDDTDLRVSVERRYRIAPLADPTLLAAGDIADCDRRGAWRTGPLLDLFPYATVAAVGDTAYPDGAPRIYARCYDPTWGRARKRTRPAVGNHEYRTAGAAGYFGYFGLRAGDSATGYYSYDLGAWHIVVLNSNQLHPAEAPDCLIVSCAAGSAQEQWLESDLAASTATCTLAYWHHPRFSSAPGLSYTALQAIWDDLYAHGVEVVLNGHVHHYERFEPQAPDGSADPNGVTEFVVGTGGAGLEHDPLGARLPTSEVEQRSAFGVLRLTLHAAGYEWEFVPEAGKRFTDAGSAACH